MGTRDELLSVTEECRISAPPNSVGERSLALSFFDVGWLLLAPVHQLFFFEFRHSKHHFIQTVIPILKHSLSITLQHFFPFAGNLIVFPSSQTTTTTRKPEIRHVEGDSVMLTFAECNHLDFDDLKGNHPRECGKFYGLIPVLANGEKVSDSMKIPLFSVQVTLFPDKGGITIGITNHHILCDASSKFNFLRAWTAMAKCGTDEPFLSSRVLPLYDRVIQQYPISLDEMFLNQPGIENLAIEYKYAQPTHYADNVRATLVLTRTHVNRLKRWVSTKLPMMEYVSSFSVACAHAWSCIAKSRTRLEEKKYEGELEMFGFAVDWRSRLIPPIPQSYFGNCVWPAFAKENTKQLSSTNGFLAAAELLGKAISETVNSKNGLIKEVESGNRKFWGDLPVTWVAGTPRLNVYDLDFGWGSPKKYELISIDYNGAISLNASKESSLDIEIGLCLPPKQMEAFISISEHGLEIICNEQAKNE